MDSTTMEVRSEEMSPFHKHWPKHTEIFDDEVCIAYQYLNYGCKKIENM